ncbi:MAG: nucleoside-binding protein [Bacteroidetes bacterium]|nr:nucleoside-binding protein [Bacteroidota bacterium]MCY4233984.1 nucleoside-binding protein [Bacteroidota bacterium]
MKKYKLFTGLIACILFFVSHTASAQMEFHYQRGSLLNPFSGEYSATNILTFQHAGNWKLGSSFFFIDFMDDADNDGFNDKEFYGEWYPTLSFSKLSGSSLKIGPIIDIAAIGGLNYDGDVNILKFLPGVRLSWRVPGFIFVNTDFAGIIDYSDGTRRENGFIFDISWLKIMNFGGQIVSFMGHAEYVSAVDWKDGSGNDVAWVLAQPQLVWDIGNLFNTPNEFHVGIELQYWANKLGFSKDMDEFRPQFLMVWRLQ